jgi:hypothetical protein
MGLVINIGLERFYRHDDENWPKAITALVEAGFTTLLRDAITPGSDLVGARVFEAKRVGKRVESSWLAPADAAPLLAELRSTYKAVGCSSSFAWHELEALGVHDIQDLAVLGDGAIPSPYGTIVLPGQEDRVRVMDLERANKAWDDWDENSNAVCHLMDFALRHRMIIHSA